MLFQHVFLGRERAQTAPGMLGGEGLEELCRAQRCGNPTVQSVLSKTLPAVPCVAVNPCLIPAAIPVC